MGTNKIILSAAVVFSGIAYAQQSQYYTPKEKYRYELAENLYQTKIYNASQFEYARQYFYNQQLSRSEKEASQFFDNVIGVMLEKSYAEKGLEAFMKEYPNSAYFAQANLPLADYYLAQKDFASALETLQKVNQYQLSKEENSEYILKLGYAKFMTGDTAGALEALEEVYAQSPGETRGQVAYMLGHLYYSENQNENAFHYFDSIKEDPKLGSLVRPYYVQLYFNNKQYDEAIEEGNSLLDSTISESYKMEVHKIIGESYFMKGEYAEAYPHLKMYLDSQGDSSESDLYEMGFVSAEAGKYGEAVSYYNRLINSNSALAQNAYYQLGNAYLQTDAKKEALSAFRSAYQMTYDPKVQKLAHEQYAKLSYDLGNPFEAPPKVIQSYINLYPQDASTSEMEKLLVKSYLYSGSFKETLDAIDKLPNSTPEIDKVDQEVSYMLGTEEFNKGNLDEAEAYFLRSLEFHLNPEFRNRALYWLAQTYYQKGNYPSAIVRFESLMSEDFPEKPQLEYDLGYAYFKSGKFERAQEHFKNYLQNPSEAFKNDAELRLADTYYANNQLNEAIAIYDKTNNANDYTLFQKGMALGFKGDSVGKIETLSSLASTYPDSDYADDALYEIAVAHASNEEYGKSNEYFNRVIKQSADSDLVANASIYLAQNEMDQGKDTEALNRLKSLAERYKDSSYAEKILLVARPLFIEKGDVEGYQNFASSMGVNINASDLDDATLGAARGFYSQKDYKKAIPLYETYLTKNPSGAARYQAQFELGDSYYQSNQQAKALVVLQEVAQVQNDYQGEAQTRVAQIYLAQGKTEEAKSYLEAIAKSSNVNLKAFANVQLMNLYAKQNDLAKAQTYANLVLANTKNSAAVLESAKVINARALLQSGKDGQAKTAYSPLERSSNASVAAEALYAKAYYQNKEKSYKSSNETIFKLANNYASEEYWGAKALVVMAKNYIGLKDNYQASYTLDQIIANYTDFPDVVAEAKAAKKQIK